MSGVLKRTVHYEYDRVNRCYHFSDWNTVITSLGTMLEPSQLRPLPVGGAQTDWLVDKVNEMTNITSIQDLTDGPGWVTGYNLAPRKGF